MENPNQILNNVQEKHSEPVLQYFGVYSQNNEIFWGKNNCHPQEIDRKLKNNETVKPLLEYLSKLMLKGELVYGYDKFENDEKKFVQIQDQRVEIFLENSNIHENYLPKATLDFITYGLAVPEFIADIWGELYSLSALQARFVRFKTDDPSKISAKPKAIYLNANRLSFTNLETRIEIPVLDIEGNTIDNLTQANLSKFVYLILENDFAFPYPEPAWQVLDTAGTLEMAEELIKSKKAYITNSRKLNYKILFDDLYFPIKFGQEAWSKKTANEKIDLQVKELENLQKIMNDPNSNGKSIASVKVNFLNGSVLQKEIDLLEIVPIESNSLNPNIDLFEHMRNTINIALGVPSSIMGTPTKDNLGGNSGSNITASYDQLSETIKSIHRKILAPLNFGIRHILRNSEFAKAKMYFKFIAPPIPKLAELAPDQRSAAQRTNNQ